MTVAGRIADDDQIADRFDRRYALYEYAGTRDAIVAFLGDRPLDVLEVGCGTGHWLSQVASRCRRIVGVEPSMPMLSAARRKLGGDRVGLGLVRATGERLPFVDRRFDRVFCVNAFHHFRDRAQFFREAYRVLRPGGGVMTIGEDPFADRDTWWVYDYFPETRAIDRARFAPVRILRGDLVTAGFAWAESFEADHIDRTQPAAEALETGVVDRAFTSQLSVLSDDAFAAGVERLRGANAAADNQLAIVADFYLFATVGWV